MTMSKKLFTLAIAMSFTAVAVLLAGCAGGVATPENETTLPGPGVEVARPDLGVTTTVNSTSFDFTQSAVSTRDVTVRSPEGVTLTLVSSTDEVAFEVANEVGTDAADLVWTMPIKIGNTVATRRMKNITATIGDVKLVDGTTTPHILYADPIAQYEYTSLDGVGETDPTNWVFVDDGDDGYFDGSTPGDTTIDNSEVYWNFQVTITWTQDHVDDYEDGSTGFNVYQSAVDVPSYADGTPPNAAGGANYCAISDQYPADGYSGAFTRLGGYSSMFGTGFTAEVDVYIEAGLGVTEGFDYSVAATRQNGAHLRDFIFHVRGWDDGSGGTVTKAYASNNSSFVPQSLGAAPVDITTAGWYTLRHTFSEDSTTGALQCRFEVISVADGAAIGDWTRTDASDLIDTVVGGNRYGWFTYVTVDGGIKVDNVKLTYN